MSKEKTPSIFPVSVFQKLEENGIITRARCRIFYKYHNRNGGYITDEFADKLLDTLPGSPVKGIYCHSAEDYTDHGQERKQGRAYGFVPETNHNIAYEQHDDEDGISRTYACADVILWTALYDEAVDIIGSPQSMELHEESLEGEWKLIEGKRVFEYSNGSFLGLQALGQTTEPCFEGAAFFSLFSSFPSEFLKSLYDSYLYFQKNNNGGQKMEDKLMFTISDEEKSDKLFRAMNETEYRYLTIATYDNYAIVMDFSDRSYAKVNFTIDENDNVALGEKVSVFAEFLDASEKDVLKAIREAKNTYSEALETLEDYSKVKEENESLAQQVEEGKTSLATLTEDLEKASSSISELTEQIEELTSYKINVEQLERQAVLDKYTELLDPSIIEDFARKISNFTAIELDKELAYELVKANSTNFTKDGIFIPKDSTEPLTGIAAILNKHK